MSNNGIVKIHGKDYMTVAKRVELAHVDGLPEVRTEVLSHTPVVIKATVMTKKGMYTGISSVDASSAKMVEKSNPYEVAETSAVGRALGFAGYGIVEGIASADEMVKAGVSPEEEIGDYNKEDAELPSDKKVCSAHDEPVVMFEGKSRTKTNPDGSPKTYWWHKATDGKICFGQGYQD